MEKTKKDIGYLDVICIRCARKFRTDRGEMLCQLCKDEES